MQFNTTDSREERVHFLQSLPVYPKIGPQITTYHLLYFGICYTHCRYF